MKAHDLIIGVGLGTFRRRATSTRTAYNVTNLDTGRELVFKSAARFTPPATLGNKGTTQCPPVSPKS